MAAHGRESRPLDLAGRLCGMIVWKHELDGDRSRMDPFPHLSVAYTFWR
jgi:hypothetical protein